MSIIKKKRGPQSLQRQPAGCKGYDLKCEKDHLKLTMENEIHILRNHARHNTEQWGKKTKWDLKVYSIMTRNHDDIQYYDLSGELTSKIRPELCATNTLLLNREDLQIPSFNLTF